MRLTVLIALAILSSLVRGDASFTVPLDTKKRIIFDYSTTGVTGVQLQKRYHALRVYPAAYFVWDRHGKAFLPVDYLYMNGRERHSYLLKKNRPIVYFDKTLRTFEIFDNLTAFKRAVKPTKETVAFAANYTVTEPNRFCARPFVATRTIRTGTKVKRYVVYGFMTGTRSQAHAYQAHLKRTRHLTAFAWLDGGNSFKTRERLPFHLIFD
jgi:hypothetical protein